MKDKVPRIFQLFSRSLTFWFIPGMLVCVFVLSGLCLFFIRRQMGSEEERLREMERVVLDRTQQLFRQEVEKRWLMAFKQFPRGVPEHDAIHVWDMSLGADTLGFSLDSSGMLLYPTYQIYQEPGLAGGRVKYAPNPGQRSSQRANRAFVPSSEKSSPADPTLVERFRQLLIKRKDREKVEELCRELLKEDITTQLEDGLPLRLPVVALYLEMREIAPDMDGSLSEAVDMLLDAYGRNKIPLTPTSLSWLERLKEQCRSRNEELAWRNRELMVDRLVKQRQFSEKFLARLNLLLRRNLYNISRFELPVQYLSSDPSENPVLVAYRFLNQPPVSMLGMVIQLEEFCQQLEDNVSKSYWVSGDVLVRIGKDFSQEVPEKLVEERILDPWAPQFTLRAMPRDYSAFERRSLYKNLLYLATVLVTGLSCILVLFFGNRALKEQERLAKLRADFLTNVSHELKTPLTAIRLHAETLERQLSGADPAVSCSAETIIEETDRLSCLISDVLEFTRLENDKRPFVWESVDLVVVIQESLQLFSQQFAEEGFEVVVDTPSSLFLQKADRAALKQTAVNLISNAIKFSLEEKSLRLRLVRAGRTAVWEVEDHGAGIDPEDVPMIFEKFFRGSKLDPAISGTGLGLTLCKAFVEAHGGTIGVESVRGRGTKFCVTLPLGEETEHGSAPGEDIQELEKTYVQNPRH